MNRNHLQQIFSNYVKKFECINYEEFYKWKIAGRFRDEMDAALSAPPEEFSAKLYEVKKLTSNLIDSYTQPFHGLVRFSEREPETVREMFGTLFEDDGGDLDKRRKRVQNFIAQSNSLRDKYFPGSYLYNDYMHSVTGYLFFYDPDNNYMYKATHAKDFAACIEFYDDWGTGNDLKLPVYYRMCDSVVEEIKNCPELLAIDAERFKIAGDEIFNPDKEKHILAFDLIYCCSEHNLFDGISFERPKIKERQLLKEREEKKSQLAEKLEKAKNEFAKLQAAVEYVNSVYSVGVAIRHKKFGAGTIENKIGDTITAEFPEVGEKNLNLITLTANGIVSVDVAGYEEKISGYRELIKRKNFIETALKSAEKNFESHAKYF